MKRIRVIKQYGGSNLIALEPADLKDFNLKTGDRVVIDDIVKCDAQGLIDSVDTVEEINSENASENMTNLLTKQRRDENAKSI